MAAAGPKTGAAAAAPKAGSGAGGRITGGRGGAGWRGGSGRVGMRTDCCGSKYSSSTYGSGSGSKESGENRSGTNRSAGAFAADPLPAEESTTSGTSIGDSRPRRRSSRFSETIASEMPSLWSPMRHATAITGRSRAMLSCRTELRIESSGEALTMTSAAWNAAVWPTSSAW